VPIIYNEYFEKFIPELENRISEFPNQINIPNHREGRPYLAYNTGIGNVQYYTEYTPLGYGQGFNGFIVGIYIHNEDYLNKFNELSQHRNMIEQQLGKPLHWLDTGAAGRIFFYLEDDIDNKENWSSIIKFQIDNLVDIVRVFKPFINELRNRPRNSTNQNIEDTQEVGKMTNKIKNIILYGSPGVGKTYNINKLISLIEEGKSDSAIFKAIKENKKSDSVDISDIKDRIKFITFHQSFGYEDFIEGFRPNEEGNIKLQDGIFKSICDAANRDRNNNYYLVIDEINRGNISKIFGELITLIEEDKRDTLEVTLPYSKQPFRIPSNLYIIGTMNSTDKSIALIDIALRRRFTFLKMKPKADLIDYLPAREIFENLNKQIEEDYQLGHSYFMKIQNNDDLEFVLEYKIIPLLEEYYYGDDRLTEVLKLCQN